MLNINLDFLSCTFCVEMEVFVCSAFLNESLCSASLVWMLMSVSSYLRPVKCSYPRLRKVLRSSALDLLRVSCPHYGCWPQTQPGRLQSHCSVFTGLHAGERSSLAPLIRGSESKQTSRQVVFFFVFFFCSCGPGSKRTSGGRWLGLTSLIYVHS